MSLKKQLFLTNPFLPPQTNDFVRDVFRDKDGFISLPFEIVAGGCVSTVLSSEAFHSITVEPRPTLGYLFSRQLPYIIIH